VHFDLAKIDISSLAGKSLLSRATGKSRLEASGRYLGDQPSDKRTARPGPNHQRAARSRSIPGSRSTAVCPQSRITFSFSPEIPSYTLISVEPGKFDVDPTYFLLWSCPCLVCTTSCVISGRGFFQRHRQQRVRRHASNVVAYTALYVTSSYHTSISMSRYIVDKAT
jgi:hypothetical protein